MTSMGCSPAVIIVVRHGARLDAADKQWHLNSPTPYDPPLTYGGFNQCRTLGVRIASLLQARDEEESRLRSESTAPNSEGAHIDIPKKKKRRVVIHTSPFLRCVQTSIALASGLASCPSPDHTHAIKPVKRVATAPLSHSGARSSSKNRSGFPQLEPIIEPDSQPSPILPYNSSIFPSAGQAQKKDGIYKSILRIDAFLGEWLSPDYFEQITPPPSSIMMVAGAKADLLRREDYAHLSAPPSHLAAPSTGFPGGWGSPIIPSRSDEVEEEGEEIELPGPSSSKRDRTSSMSSMGSAPSSSSRLSCRTPVRQPALGQHEADIYVPPVPHYAISTSDPIPPGYVAHSKDACVEIDYQWDSMRSPQNWGDGGEYGEEWGSMHKRFRRGIKMLVDWYKNHDIKEKSNSRNNTTPGISDRQQRRWLSNSSSSEDPVNDKDEENEDEEEEKELVIVLVTHGAGCNALIGALTNHPALLDVGMANLTMAVRKPPPTLSTLNTPSTTPRPTPSHSRNPSRQLTLADEYEMKLVNSSEHLRKASTSSAKSFTAHLNSLPCRPFLNRTSDTLPARIQNSPFMEPISLGEPIRSPFHSTSRSSSGSEHPGLVSLRRTVSVASGSGSSPGGRTYTPRFKGSVGLWTPKRPSLHSDDAKDQDEEKEDDTRGDDMVLNFAEEREEREARLSYLTSPIPDLAKLSISANDEKERRRPSTNGSDGTSRKNIEGKEKEKEIWEQEFLEADASPSFTGGGLWANQRVPETEMSGSKPWREPGLKRRWTLTEADGRPEH